MHQNANCIFCLNLQVLRFIAGRWLASSEIEQLQLWGPLQCQKHKLLSHLNTTTSFTWPVAHHFSLFFSYAILLCISEPTSSVVVLRFIFEIVLSLRRQLMLLGRASMCALHHIITSRLDSVRVRFLTLPSNARSGPDVFGLWDGYSPWTPVEMLLTGLAS